MQAVGEPVVGEIQLGLWGVVPLSAHVPPSDTQRSRVRRGWRELSRWLRLGHDQRRDAALDEQQLRRLPEVRLAHLVPPVEWLPAAEALEQAWRPDGDGPEVIFLVTAPQDDSAAILAHWAERHSARVLSPPPEEALLEGDGGWVDRLAGREGAWVMPRLERCFLRHVEGLAGVRRFVEQALAGRLGPGIIGCDSWAWAYLQHILALPEGQAFTLKPFDGADLDRYFAAAARHGCGHVPRILSVRNGESVLLSGEEGAAPSQELRQLAAHCRGQLGLAWHYWRQRLCSAEEGGVEGVAVSPEAWLRDTLDEPMPPAELGEEAILLLHALLLHGGLSPALLAAVLPVPKHRLLGLLRQLATLGLVEEGGRRWRVAPLGYVRVRHLLAERAYLTDPL